MVDQETAYADYNKKLIDSDQIIYLGVKYTTTWSYKSISAQRSSVTSRMSSNMPHLVRNSIMIFQELHFLILHKLLLKIKVKLLP